MYKSALFGALIVSGLAIATAAPAQAGPSGFNIQISKGHHGPAINVHYKRNRFWVSPRQIRRTVRSYGCYDISQVRRVNKRYKVRATCGYDQRVKMVFSARSGRLISERVVGYQPRYKQFSQYPKNWNRRH